MSKKIFIYGLVCPETKEVRYVGRTDNIKARLTTHLNEKGNSPKCQWVRELLNNGQSPEIIILEEANIKNQVEAEIKWITHYTPTGKLTNVLNGGGGKSNNDITYKSITFRLPEVIYNWLEKGASKEFRSINKQLEYVLELEMIKQGVFSIPCNDIKHYWTNPNPATSETCNCGAFVYGEVAR